MPRPRQFDPDAVLDAAQRVFHERGYEGTSVQHLVDATGLSRSSLYGAFGDKHGLFLAALDRYAEAGRTAGDAVCDGAAPLDAIGALLRQSARPTDGPRGCLMVNAAAERADLDADTATRADAARRGLDARFEALVGCAQAAGEADPARPARDLARFLTGAVFGLRALQTAGADADALDAVVAGALAALRPTA